LGTKARAWSAAAASMRSNASTTTVMALRVSAAREDESHGRCDYEFPHWLTSFIR